MLLVDEPTAGLDDPAGAAVLDLLAALADAEGTAVLVATHDGAAAGRAGFTVHALEAGLFRHAPAEAVA